MKFFFRDIYRNKNGGKFLRENKVKRKKENLRGSTSRRIWRRWRP